MSDNLIEEWSLVQFNIDQANREEKHLSTQFDVRWPRLLALIKSRDADIVCLQELRNLLTSKIQIRHILFEMGEIGYDHVHAFYGPDQISFALGTFYKRNKLFVSNTTIHLLPLADEKKPNISYVILNVQFRSTTSGKTFRVLNTHFGLGEEEKLAYAQATKDLLKTIEEPFLCAGDYNFFDDRDGGIHRKILLEHFKDIAFPLHNVSGTFMGFDHDEFKQPFDKMSRLDHVFSNQIILESLPVAWGNMEEVKTRTYPSDHLMITFDFSLDSTHSK
jgi:endonuclease/exonuclease/phosphatase family metal-dependent hydrolase